MEDHSNILYDLCEAKQSDNQKSLSVSNNQGKISSKYFEQIEEKHEMSSNCQRHIVSDDTYEDIPNSQYEALPDELYEEISSTIANSSVPEPSIHTRQGFLPEA